MAAALNAQSALDTALWPGPALRVRMGLHLGEAEEREGDYFGSAVTTAARVAAAGHGGQVLATDPVRMTSHVTSRDLGPHYLRDVDEPICLFQLGGGAFPPLRAGHRALTNLPVRPTKLIGRDDDVDRVRRLLADHRLVTVTAVGGSGKTRVAIATGEVELPERTGGVWFADLAALTGGTGVPAAIGKAVGLSLREGDPTAQVIDYLGDKAAMVILDNCEHVIDACAEFAERFLASMGDSVILATSREPLAVDGEATMRLGPLAAEDGDAPAIRLFNERAMSADSRFVPESRHAGVVVAICRHLDGLPLAIELAAARTTTMTLPEIEAALEDRFHFLGGGRRPPRQRTLQATLDWSYALLRGDEQRVVRALSVFVDGFDVDGVTNIVGVDRASALGVLDALTSKSWVVRLDTGDRARFGLLETVKAYGEDRLAETGEFLETRDRHLDHFHRLATARGHSGLSELRLGRALGPERRNLTAAFEWAAATGRWPQAAELIAGACSAYILSGAALEALQLLQRALGATTDERSELADQLRAAITITSVWLTDWVSYRVAAQELTASTRALMRALGHTALGVSTPFADDGASLAHVRRAHAALASAIDSSPKLLHDLDAGLIRWVEGRVAAGRGDIQAGFEGCMDFLTKCRSIDYYPTPAPRAARLAAICQILLGHPTSAIDTLAWLEALDPTFTTDDVRALAYVAEGRMAEAVPLIRIQAEEGLSGRMPGQVCDSVALLAALTDAEGEAEQTCGLLCHMGAGLDPGFIMLSRHLARRRGVSIEHAEMQDRALAYREDSPQGYNGTRMASDAVRDELARRGWE